MWGESRLTAEAERFWLHMPEDDSDSERKLSARFLFLWEILSPLYHNWVRAGASGTPAQRLTNDRIVIRRGIRPGTDIVLWMCSKWSLDVAQLGREGSIQFVDYCSRLLRESFLMHLGDGRLQSMDDAEQQFMARFFSSAATFGG